MNLSSEPSLLVVNRTNPLRSSGISGYNTAFYIQNPNEYSNKPTLLVKENWNLSFFSFMSSGKVVSIIATGHLKSSASRAGTGNLRCNFKTISTTFYPSLINAPAPKNILGSNNHPWNPFLPNSLAPNTNLA